MVVDHPVGIDWVVVAFVGGTAGGAADVAVAGVGAAGGAAAGVGAAGAAGAGAGAAATFCCCC